MCTSVSVATCQNRPGAVFCLRSELFSASGDRLQSRSPSSGLFRNAPCPCAGHQMTSNPPRSSLVSAFSSRQPRRSHPRPPARGEATSVSLLGDGGARRPSVSVSCLTAPLFRSPSGVPATCVRPFASKGCNLSPRIPLMIVS